jgi:spermidine synthase/MFS family permease
VRKPAAASLVLGLLAVAGAAVMTLEILGPRLVAPHLGTTSLVWTTTIATFLGGIASGNVVGGRLSDRGVGVGRLLLLGAAATALLLPLEGGTRSLFAALPHGARVLATVPAVFLPAAFALGLAPPSLARRLLAIEARPGRALGRAGAAASAGSVAGTFLAGFVLVPRFGMRALVGAVAATLALAALAAWTLGAEAVGPDDAERASPAPPPGSPRLAWPLLAGLAGAALLVLEVHAGRMAGEFLGTSVYSWTAVIGVALAALAAGNLLGGWLADRADPRRALGPTLAAAGGASLLALAAPAVMGSALHLEVAGGAVGYPIRILVGVLLPYALPALLVGIVSPVVIRAALREDPRRGRVVGRLYAAGTAGAVLAALAVPTLLVPELGRDGTLLLLAAVLVGASARLAPAWALAGADLVLLGAAVLLLPAPWAEELRTAAGLVPAERRAVVEDSRYFRIVVEPTKLRWVHLAGEPDLDPWRDAPILGRRAGWDDGRLALYWEGRMTILQRAWLARHVDEPRAVEALYRRSRHDVRRLRLDRLVHSYVDLDDPRWLGYDYELLYERMVQRLAPASAPVRCLFLGGGGYAFQRHLLARRGDGLAVVTAEIDPAVTRMAMQHLGLEDDPRHHIVHDDARTYVDTLPEDAPPFDLVFGDAFNDLAVPFHLTTREFAGALHARMAPDGVYMINVIDNFASARFLVAFANTLRTTFADVHVYATGKRVPDSRDTFVVVASDRDLDADLAGLTDAAAGPMRVDRIDLDALRGREGCLVLTDDFAPVEALLAPVVEGRDRRGGD